jgi:hypothetical protein
MHARIKAKKYSSHSQKQIAWKTANLESAFEPKATDIYTQLLTFMKLKEYFFKAFLIKLKKWDYL